jgi:hypothetical protein
VIKARQTLAASPEDPAANLEAGRYECFMKERWETGLDLLAKSSNAPLSALASKEAEKPSDAAAQVALADGWWQMAEKEEGFARIRVRRRAIHWYAEAWPRLDDAFKIPIRKRLSGLGVPLLLPGPSGPRSPTVGGSTGSPFEDRPPIPSILVGFRYGWGTIVIARGATVMDNDTNPVIKALQPVYLSDRGSFSGRVCGVPSGSLSEILARPGYAVGAVVAKGGARVDGLKIVFMRIAGFGLDPKDSYESRWIGGKGGTDEKILGGDGAYIVGIHGNCGENLDNFGILQAHQ